jgi:D-sedoheptulose 7-phosphate isomerase
MKEQITSIFDSNARLQKQFLKENLDVIISITDAIVDAVSRGNKVLFFGNGGSAADAQHLAAEFINRFRLDRRALPAVALTTDTSVLTSIANDSGYDKVFARQIEALGREADVAVGLSTSGASPNVTEGIRVARREGLVTVAFAGGDGGRLRQEADHCLLVSSTDTPRVQEMHILSGHAICELVEKAVADASHFPS